MGVVTYMYNSGTSPTVGGFPPTFVVVIGPGVAVAASYTFGGATWNIFTGVELTNS